MTTKNDLYDYLTHLGVTRGFSVIAEFRAPLPRRRWKAIDLVWAKRRPTRPQVRSTLEEWRLFAAFEIEGSNVRLAPREFRRHLEDFPDVVNLHGEEIQKHVVLYTSAYDRRWNAKGNRESEIARCTKWASDSCFRVLDGRLIETYAEELPFLSSASLKAGRLASLRVP